MPSRRLALVGACKGQWVPIVGVLKPRIKVTGLPLGRKVTIRVDDVIYILSGNGEHEVEEGKWLLAETDAPVGRVICEVISRTAA